ncbi:hypothetical protein B0T17DRAFT_488716 [Bombardia bombarda]|uniref:AMP-activated protein kinase glycogen-binding domain-containing protein n=1 Tax=Bombardia bombarda TaxID=252184 RepID=A0AA39XAZ6_9PEZI|nr:hypothetical protein B0T17DRAFT_488716 [Bombardia bombarda]
MTSSSVVAPVTITYRKPGTQPPLYVAGTFSDPPWQPQEMDFTTDSQGEHVFKKKILGKPGSKVHYKFRVGSGDWWVLNDELPTAVDSSGNQNNELEVPSLKGRVQLVGITTHDAAKPERKQNVGNSYATTLKATLPHDTPPHPVAADAAKELLGRSEPRSDSGASTPTYARTAAEVADSAALLNKEEPESQMPDDEAGRIGFRRLTATPISEVANTAAEVADSAKKLDREEVSIFPDRTMTKCGELNMLEAIIELETPVEVASHLEPLQIPDESSPVDYPLEHRPSLFAHECIGMYDVEEAPPTDEHEPVEEHRGSEAGKKPDMDNIDINDPTLEQFPFKREDIIDTVRKLETGLNEDRVAFEGAPISPVVGSVRRGNEDITGDSFLASPIAASPIIPRPSKRLEVPHGSIGSAHSSSLSLQSISEAEEPSSTSEDNVPSPAIRLSPPTKKSKLSTMKSPDSDEDEGIAMKDSESPGTPKPDDAGHHLSPASAALPRQVSPKDSEEAAAPEEDSAGVNGWTGETTHNNPSDATNGSIASSDVGKTTGAAATENGNSSQVKKRGPAAVQGGERPDTPASIHSTSGSSVQGIHHHQVGWFRAFFRLLFVDWIGGLITRLCNGGRRQTLLTAGAAAFFMGVGWWKAAGKDGHWELRERGKG